MATDPTREGVAASKRESRMNSIRRRKRRQKRHGRTAIYAIENLAALRAYRAELGASEWEAVLKPEEREALDYFYAQTGDERNA